MARIVGVDIPNEKRIVVSLTYIYGIGPSTAEKICAATGVNVDIRTKDLTDEQLTALRNEVSKYHTEGDLRRETALNIKAGPAGSRPADPDQRSDPQGQAEDHRQQEAGD